MKSIKHNIGLTIFIICLGFINSQYNSCKLSTGCLLRTKFFSYVSFQSQEGASVKYKSSLDNKIIYLYKDRLVFYQSDQPSETNMELELKEVIPKSIDEGKVERIIYFSEIILDCGKFNNNLCHAKNYSHISGIKYFKKIREKIPSYPEIKCLAIPFYENSYKIMHEKIAFICIEDFKLLFNLIEFKHYLSRAIELYHFNLGNDRYNSFNGLLRKEIPLVYYNSDNKHINILARVYGKKINLVTNDKFTTIVREISLYEFYNSKGYIVKKAIEKGLLTENWNKDFELNPTKECCIVYLKRKYKENYHRKGKYLPMCCVE